MLLDIGIKECELAIVSIYTHKVKAFLYVQTEFSTVWLPDSIAPVWRRPEKVIEF